MATLAVLALRSFHRKYNAGNTFIRPQNPGFSKRKGQHSCPKKRKRRMLYAPSVSSADSLVFSAPSSAPSMAVKYCSGQSFSLWLIRCRCALPSRMTSGLKYRSTGSPHTLISCMITGKLGIVPSFSIFASYRESMLTISANVLRDRCFALRAAFTSAPKVSKPGQSLIFAILHHPLTLYSSYFVRGMLLYAIILHFIIRYFGRKRSRRGIDFIVMIVYSVYYRTAHKNRR